MAAPAPFSSPAGLDPSCPAHPWTPPAQLILRPAVGTKLGGEWIQPNGTTRTPARRGCVPGRQRCWAAAEEREVSLWGWVLGPPVPLGWAAGRGSRLAWMGSAEGRGELREGCAEAKCGRSPFPASLRMERGQGSGRPGGECVSRLRPPYSPSLAQGSASSRLLLAHKLRRRLSIPPGYHQGCLPTLRTPSPPAPSMPWPPDVLTLPSLSLAPGDWRHWHTCGRVGK